MMSPKLYVVFLCLFLRPKPAFLEDIAEIHADFDFNLDLDSRDELCPDASVIKPCVCTVEEIILNFDCSAVISEDQLKTIFKDSFVGSNARKLTIKDNNFLTGLHQGTFGKTDFIEIDIRGTGITAIEAGAFDASYRRAEKMIFKNNKILSFPFDEVTHFITLKTLDLSSNILPEFPRLKSDTLEDFFMSQNMINNIPVDSFQFTPQLQRIRLKLNTISKIERGTFNSLKYLREVDYLGNSLTEILSDTFIFNSTMETTSIFLGYNDIQTVGVNAFAGAIDQLQVYSNSISLMEEAVWRPLLENGTRLDISDNPLECGCDIAWVIRESDILEKVTAACKDGLPIDLLDPAAFDDCP